MPSAQLEREATYRSMTIWWEAPPEREKAAVMARNNALLDQLKARPGAWAKLPATDKAGATIAKALAHRGAKYKERTTDGTTSWWAQWPEGEG